MRVLSLFLFWVFSIDASAGGVTTTLKRVGLVNDQYANIKISTAVSDVPSCANTNQFFSFDKTTEHGKQIFSLLLAAYMANKQVYLNYSPSDCGLYGTQTLLLRADLRDD